MAVLEGDPGDHALPPYLADLVFLGRPVPGDRAGLERAFRSLRPYGGVLYAHRPGRGFRQLAETAGLPGARVEAGTGFVRVERVGAPPGSAPWTHEYAGPSNRSYTDDELVRAPLGVLWFGGPSNHSALPRHRRGPVPQVAGGRLFLLGVDGLGARCVYTGRELWRREIPGIGHPFTDLELEERFRAGETVGMGSRPGASVTGSPLVSLEDAVYIRDGALITRLDPATGEKTAGFRLPFIPGIRQNEWGHLLAWGDYLVATVDPQVFSGPGGGPWWDRSSSSLIVVLDRHDGRLKWVSAASRLGYRHNAIAVGNGRVFAVDGLSETARRILARRGLEEEEPAALVAFDIATGRKIWRSEEGVFGTWLGYYEERDLLVEGGHGRYLPDEPRESLVARDGATGALAWVSRGRYLGPLVLHREMILPTWPGLPVLDPASGETVSRDSPFDGRTQPFTYQKFYGCGTLNASAWLVAHRSGTAGFTDLRDFGGTGNLGGFRAGCTDNLVPADGVLNAPDYTRTCTCSYQLQSSFAFVHEPSVEMWTLHWAEPPDGEVGSLGINFGAPGARLAGGVPWLEYPAVSSRYPEAVRVEVSGAGHSYFRNHASWLENPGAGHAWVGSRGIEGVGKLTVGLGAANGGSARDITLYFAEPGAAGPGERVFDVVVRGRTAVEGLDIAARAGGPRRLEKVVLEGVPAGEKIEIEFRPRPGSLPAVISGFEAHPAAGQGGGE